MQLGWVEAWFESVSQIGLASPNFSSHRLPHVWHMRNVPGWPELDAYYALGDSDPKDVIAEVRSTDPDRSLLVTIFSKSEEAVFELYRDHGLVHSGNFSQPFMWREIINLSLEDQAKIRNEAFEHEVRLVPGGVEYTTNYADRVVSSAKASLNDNGVSYIWGMHTDTEFRGLGLASYGLDALLRASRLHGMHTAVLCASPMGVPFYLANGFASAADMIALCPEDRTAWLKWS